MARPIHASVLLLATACVAAPAPAPAARERAVTRDPRICTESAPVGFRRAVKRAERIEKWLWHGRTILSLVRSAAGDDVLEELDLDDPRNAGAEDAIVALAAFEATPRTGESVARAAAALALAVAEGGSETRRRAALDLVSDAGFASGLDAVSAGILARVVDRATGLSPELPSLLMVLGARGDRARVIGALEKERGDKVVKVVADVLGRAGLQGTGDALAALLASEDAEVRLRAASVLARLESDEGRGALAARLRSSDAELQAMALVAHAGTESAEARSVSLDVVRRHMAPARVERTAVERVRASRAGPASLERGEALRLRAAGFVLARSTEEDRRWLRARLARLDDPAAAEFLAGRLAEPWAAFDD